MKNIKTFEKFELSSWFKGKDDSYDKINATEFRDRVSRRSDKNVMKLKDEAEKAFDSVMKKIYKQLKDSNEDVVKINMPVFFTSSSNGRNGYLLQMVTSELQSNGFYVEKSIDGRDGDRYDWVKISHGSNIDFYN